MPRGILRLKHCPRVRRMERQLLDPLSRSSIMEEPVMFNNLAPFQSDPTSADAASYIQTDLVSDIVGLATIADPELINPFGVSHSSTSPFWVSNNAINTSTLYAVTDSTNVTKTEINPPSGFVAIPTTASGTASGNQGPTGQVFNTFGSSFPVGNGGVGEAAHLIFVHQ